MRILKRYGHTLSGVVMTAIALMPLAARAQFAEGVRRGVERANEPVGLTGLPLVDIIGGIINVVLGLLGILLLAQLIYAGFLYMTAGGSDEKVTKARGMILNAIIGIVIVASSFAIANFVLQGLLAATVGTASAG